MIKFNLRQCILGISCILGTYGFSQLTPQFRYGADLNYYNRIYKTIKLAYLDESDQLIWTTWMASDLYISKGLRDLLDFKTQKGQGGDGNWVSPVVDSIYFNLAAATKVCPAGWRLPRLGEWDTLMNFTTRAQKEFMFPKLNGYKSHHTRPIENKLLKEVKILQGGYWWISDADQVNSVKLDVSYNYEKGLADSWDRASVRCIKIASDDN